jgi:hypothetical protein
LFHGGAGGIGGIAGSNLGIGSGFEPAMHETVVNNYYGDADSNQHDEQAAQGHYDDQGQDAGYDGEGFDSGDDSYDV